MDSSSDMVWQNDAETNWNDIPNEIKLIMIGHMDRDTRTALKLCSWHDKQLVESVPLRTLRICSIDFSLGGVELYTYPEGMAPIRNLYDFELNDGSKCCCTKDQLDQFDCIDAVTVMSHQYLKKWKFHTILLLTNYNFLMKVRFFVSFLDAFEATNLLKQIDPKFLKIVRMELDGFNLDKETKLYGMPQISTAERLSIGPNWMSDEQLINLEARSLNLARSEKITADGVNRFIKKNLQDLNKDQFEFSINYQPAEEFYQIVFQDLDIDREVLYNRQIGNTVVNSPFPNFKLEIKLVQGLVKGRRIVKTDGSDVFAHEKMDDSCICFDGFSQDFI